MGCIDKIHTCSFPFPVDTSFRLTILGKSLQ